MGPRVSSPPRRAFVVLGFLLSALLSWFGLELVGQLYFGKPYYYAKYQYTYDSPDPIINIRPGLWTYRPNAKIDEVTLFKKPFGSYFIESSCEYDIDDIGFIGNENGRRDYDILLLGASFTAGTGGCPWTSELRQRLPQLAIFNAGIPGTGIPNWAAAEAYLLDRGFRFRHVFLMITSGDFF